jgi:two-component system cell cycle sensor histidine kinase/response regulator CckA
MPAPTARVARATRRLALATVFLVASLLPAAAFMIAYEREVSAVESELEIGTGHVNRLVSSAPDLWQLQAHRIEDIVTRHAAAASPELWQVLDAQGRLIVAVGSDGGGFQLIRARPLLDAGERVGEIRVARSLTGVLSWTAGVALASGLLGTGIYVMLRVLPIRALERSEGRLLAIMDSAPDAFLMLEPTGRITLSNASAATLFGLSSSEMAGRHLSELIKTSDRPGLEAVIERFRGAASSPRDTAETMELTGLNPHQDDFPAEGRFSAWRTDAETSIVCVLRDVTDRRKTQAALARLVAELQTRQARLEALLAIGRELSRFQPVEPLLSRVAEACGRLFDAESAAFRLRDGDDLQVCSIWGTTKDLIPTPPLKVGESLTGIVAATGEPLIADDPGNDPRLIPLHRERYRQAGIRAFLGVPVKVDERVVGVLTIRITREGSFSADDVEIAKAFAAQAAIALENSRLYEETQSALRQLSQTRDQLVQSQKMEAIGQLAGGVAHDFNNLLTIIIGRSQLFLARVPAVDPGRRDVEMVNRAAERAAGLTRQLLAFSRKQVLKPEPLDLNALVGGLAPMLRRLIGEHIDLVLAPGGDLGQVMADPGQIEQVVMNLVVNARDAMPDGGTLKVQTERAVLVATREHLEGRIPPGDYAAVRVQDAGCGMDPATLAKIFEPFFTTKETGKGTGLGLSTVYGIVNQSGGHVGVDTAPGRGTTFTIYLPRTAAAPAPPPPSGGDAAMVGGSETILLVEDEDEVRQLAADLLEACGYTVLATGDPREALTIAERRGEEIDLLVTDMVMPTIRGSALAAQLRRQMPDLRLLYVSGYTDEMATPGGKIEPPAPLLQKPFTPPALARAVRDVLDAGSGPGGRGPFRRIGPRPQVQVQ